MFGRGHKFTSKNIKKQKKNTVSWRGGVVSSLNWGGLSITPREGCENITASS